MKKTVEEMINDAIVGDRRPGGLGTILPTRASERCNERMYRYYQKRKEQIGTAQLACYDRREEAGETRYYDGANRYAIVNSAGRVLWFVRRNGDWYAA